MNFRMISNIKFGWLKRLKYPPSRFWSRLETDLGGARIEYLCPDNSDYYEIDII